jgi:hypothetical protein
MLTAVLTLKPPLLGAQLSQAQLSCHHLKDLVYQEPPVTIMELQEKIEEACEQVTSELCRKACRSVERRLQDCLEREGYFVSY